MKPKPVGEIERLSKEITKSAKALFQMYHRAGPHEFDLLPVSEQWRWYDVAKVHLNLCEKKHERMGGMNRKGARKKDEPRRKKISSRAIKQPVRAG